MIYVRQNGLIDVVKKFFPNCLKTYNFMIHPIPSEKDWTDIPPNQELLAPVCEKKKGGLQQREVGKKMNLLFV